MQPTHHSPISLLHFSHSSSFTFSYLPLTLYRFSHSRLSHTISPTAQALHMTLLFFFTAFIHITLLFSFMHTPFPYFLLPPLPPHIPETHVYSVNTSRWHHHALHSIVKAVRDVGKGSHVTSPPAGGISGGRVWANPGRYRVGISRGEIRANPGSPRNPPLPHGPGTPHHAPLAPWVHCYYISSFYGEFKARLTTGIDDVCSLRRGITEKEVV